MKLQLKIATGTRLEVEILPTDTFESLICRTARESGATLTLKHFKLPNKAIALKSNIVHYFTGKVPEELVSSHFPAQMCRLCAKPGDHMTFIFTDDRLCEMINTWLPTHVSRCDELPKQVCTQCLLRLEVCKDFQMECVWAELKLKGYLAEGKYSLPVRQPSTSSESAEVASREIDCGFLSAPNRKSRTEAPPPQAGADSADYCCPLCHAGRITSVEGEVQLSGDEDEVVSGDEDEVAEVGDDEVAVVGDDEVAVVGDDEVVVVEGDDVGGDEVTLVEVDVEEEGAREQQPEMECPASDTVEIKQEVTDIQCRMCECLSADMEALLQHSLETHCVDKSLFPCPLCPEQFPGPLELIGHFSTRHNLATADQLFFCKHCYVLFPSRLQLTHHDCSRTTAQLECRVCRAAFKSKVRLEFHKQSHLPDATPLRCRDCAEDFYDENASYKHFRLFHENQPMRCLDCGKSFVNHNSLVIHSRFHSNQRKYQCGTCSKRFLDKQTLGEHMMAHMRRTPYQCGVCRRYLARKSRLKSHMRTHEAPECVPPQRVFLCALCARVFPSQARALTHGKTRHKQQEFTFKVVFLEKVLRCEFCNEDFATSEELSAHRTAHTGDRRYRCDMCSAAFESFARLTTHKVKHNADKVSGEEADCFSVPQYYVCDAPACDKMCVHWASLRMHKRQVHAQPDTQHQCKICPKTFHSAVQLSKHRSTKHNASPGGRRSNVKLRAHNCLMCDKSFMTARGLDKHQEACHKGDTYQCRVCNKLFQKQAGLDKHMAVHQEEKKKCGLCHKSFFHASSLAKHMHTHAGHSPYKCAQCERPCVDRTELDEHMRLHTGEKPFECQVCKKTFRTRGVWLQHSRIHTGERPYACHECGVSFRRSWALKNHLLIHSGEKPFLCQLCDGAFRLKQDLQRHESKEHVFTLSDVCTIDLSD